MKTFTNINNTVTLDLFDELEVISHRGTLEDFKTYLKLTHTFEVLRKVSLGERITIKEFLSSASDRLDTYKNLFGGLDSSEVEECLVGFIKDSETTKEFESLLRKALGLKTLGVKLGEVRAGNVKLSPFELSWTGYSMILNGYLYF